MGECVRIHNSWKANCGMGHAVRVHQQQAKVATFFGEWELLKKPQARFTGRELVWVEKFNIFHI